MSDSLSDISQAVVRVPSSREKEFMNSVAIPTLDATRDESSLKDLSDVFWNLCLWERDRANVIDTKASYLLGLSSIGGAVVAVGGVAHGTVRSKLLLPAAIALGLFILTVIASLWTLLGKAYGTFNDRDTFDSLRAHEGPIGEIRAFEDKDARRCFLRELALQRWLIYRWYGDANDSRFSRLVLAQVLAVASTVSLLGFIVVVVGS